MVLKKRISMKEYFVEVYNNTMKMWDDITVLASSVEEAVAIILNDEKYSYSIISVKEKED
jgi:hypothetical protein